MSCWSKLNRNFLLLQLGFVLSLQAEPTVTNTITASGRNYFYDNERIDVILPTEKGTAVEFIHEDGFKLSPAVSAQNGKIYLNLLPYALPQGRWSVKVSGQNVGTIHVVNAVPQTRFIMWNYQAWLDDAKDTPWGQMMGSGTTEERFKLYQDYGMNFLALQNGGFGMSIRTMDHIVKLGARYSSLNTMAGQHQPGGANNDWSGEEVAVGVRCAVQHNAQYGRRFGAFAGVHYADEPGLTYGIKDEKGEYQVYYSGGAIPDASKNYFGPLAVPGQMDLYTKTTGKKAPDPLNPSADMESWLKFMRFRTTILGRVFEQATADLHAIDAKLLGYSQLYAWMYLADGLYPAENGKGVDMVSSHAYIDNMYGLFYPVNETDMMRTGAWDKPLVMMPMFEGMTRRSVTYASLSRQIEGLGWDRTSSFMQPGMLELSRRIVPLSGIFTQITKKRDDIAVFYSRDQYLYEIASEVKKNRIGPYVGRLIGAWLACFVAHCPANYVIEEDFASGEALKHKVIIAPALKVVSDKTRHALEQYVKAGGTLVLEQSSPVSIAGAVRINVVFPDFGNTGKWNAQEANLNERQRIEKHIVPLAAVLAETLKDKVKPVILGGDPLLLASIQDGGAVRYLWAVNMNHETVNQETHLNTSFELPAAAGIYDCFNGREVTERKQTLNMPAGDAMLYALLPGKITQVEVKDVTVDGPGVTIAASVLSDKALLAGVIPLSIEITDARGKLFKQIYRATDASGMYSEKLELGRLEGAGEWKVKVKELLSGKDGMKPFKPDTQDYPFALVGPVEVNDAVHILRTCLQKDKTVLVLYGSDDMKPKADAIVKLCQARKIKAKIDKAANHMKERQGLAMYVMYLSWYQAPLVIDQPVIIVGDRKNNPLMTRLIDTLNLSPHPITPAYPGPGRGLLYWAKTVFGFNQDVVVVYGEDSRSLDEASDALGKILSGELNGGDRFVTVKPSLIR